MKFTHNMMSVYLASLLILSGCGSDGSGPSTNSSSINTNEISTDANINVENYNSSMSMFEASLRTQFDANLELIALSSNNFTQSINGYNMSSYEIEQYNIKAYKSIPLMATALLQANYINDLTNIIKPSMINTSSASYAKPRFAFTTLVLVAGILWTAKGAYDGVTEAINDTHTVARDSISGANTEELQHINSTLGLSQNASKAEAIAKYNGLSLSKKTNLGKAIIDINSEYGDDTSIIKARTAIGNSSKKLGKVAVTTTVGLVTTATGGQGLDKVAKALGASENLAAGIDLAISVSGNQPLDHVVIAAESKSHFPQNVAASPISIEEAKAILEKAKAGEIKNIQEISDALTTVMNKVARSLPDAEVHSDGSVTAPMAEKAHIQSVSKVHDGDRIIVPEIGPAKAVITAENTLPEVIEDLDLTVIAGVALEAENILSATSATMSVHSTEISSDKDSITYKVSLEITGVQDSTTVRIDVSNASTSSSTKTLYSDGSVSWNVTVLKQDASVSIKRLDTGSSLSLSLSGVGNSQEEVTQEYDRYFEYSYKYFCDYGEAVGNLESDGEGVIGIINNKPYDLGWGNEITLTGSITDNQVNIHEDHLSFTGTISNGVISGTESGYACHGSYNGKESFSQP